jgi:glutathione synthase/RimK-type ligase-like ATP-grasp enzyme
MTTPPNTTIVVVKDPGVTWRIFEKECMQAYFGGSDEANPCDSRIAHLPDHVKYVYWKLHTEATSQLVWEQCCKMSAALKRRGVKMINDPEGWLGCHAKEEAFRIWQQIGIPCPQWFYFTGAASFLQMRSKTKDLFGYPMLVRINNSTGGCLSFLEHNDSDAQADIDKLVAQQGFKHDHRDNTGVNRRFIAVQYIPTTRPEKVNLSFRIIVAGNRVVTGYARIGPPNDWIVITNRFHKGMEETFVRYQKLCQSFIAENEGMIVKAVRCLGLNFQGIDVILDQENRPYFLEVQPGFSVGYAQYSAWRPPFYNPSKPPELRQFLIDNLPRLKKEIPLYANMWLDKYAMFNAAFRNLKEQLG